MKVLILTADNFEDSELLVPYYRFLEENIPLVIASTRRGTIRGKHGYEVEVGRVLSEVNADDYDLLLLPGGKAPAELRKQQAALQIAQRFFAENKPVAAICHGPQILISAGLLKGRRATCYKAMATEMKEAGAEYQDRELVVDDNLVTARQPSDIPAFMREIMKRLRT